MKVLDSHFHLWQLSHVPQPWIDPATMSAINRDFSTADYLTAMQSSLDSLFPNQTTQTLEFGGGILVQTVHAAHETPHYLELASTNHKIRGVVGWIDLTASDYSQRLADLLSAPTATKLVGLRHQIQDEPGAGALSDPRFFDALKALNLSHDRALTFDLIVRPDQLVAAAEVAARLPEQQFVLDHLGKPELAAHAAGTDISAQWKKAISALAQLPNVAIKMSGLSTQADWHNWTVHDLRPAFEHAFDQFGVDRMMWGSDWPVVNISGGAGKWTAACAELTRELRPAEQEAFWGGTAARSYGIDQLNDQQ
jgi:L-fuconolactonase